MTKITFVVDGVSYTATVPDHAANKKVIIEAIKHEYPFTGIMPAGEYYGEHEMLFETETEAFERGAISVRKRTNEEKICNALSILGASI